MTAQLQWKENKTTKVGRMLVVWSQRRRRRDFRDFHGSPCCRDTKVVGTLNCPREKRKKGKKEGKERKKKEGKEKKVKERKKKKEGKGKLSVYQLYFFRNCSNHKFV